MERSRSTKATKNRIDSGVAGRNMMARNAVSRYRRAGSPKTGLHGSIVVLRLKMIAQQSGPEKGTMVRQVADGRLSAANVIQGNERRIKRLMELFAFALTIFAAATLSILSSSEQSCTKVAGSRGRQLGRAKRQLGLGSGVKPQCMEDHD